MKNICFVFLILFTFHKVFCQTISLTRSLTITDLDAPMPRSNAAFVVKDSSVLLFGGETASVFVSDPYYYFPKTNTWQSLNISGTVEKRASIQGVWTGSKYMFYGGTTASAKKTSFITFDPLTNVWENDVYNSNKSGSIGVSSVLADSTIIIYGGHDGTIVNANGKIFNLQNNSWSSNISTTNAPGARQGHSAAWTGEEMIIWGGSVGINPTSTTLSTGKIYNPKTNSWRNMSSVNAPSARTYASAIWTGKYFIVYGGSNGSNDSIITLSDGAAYDYENDSWHTLQITDPLSARYAFQSAYFDAQIIMFGGYNYESLSYLGDGAIFSSDALAIENAKNTIQAQVYPNPCTNLINIDLESTLYPSVELHLVDLTGKILHSEKVKNISGKILLDFQLNSGMYLLEIITEHGKKTQKLIVE